MNKRKLLLIENFVNKFSELVDEGVEMFIEKRECLWPESGVLKARNDLEEKIEENEFRKAGVIKQLLSV